ncbi:putative Peroxidase 48 [Macadamia integrifolia]|uniref:putative Peroxidase 48 n=1 Tax=Macadamia integrifolia TaxID=60698 RepID=UPI001C4F3E89|nr:putative Peroxidase 48 [Macadamia integrifolia]
MRELTAENSETPAALLRLVFHDCFIRGCDASILLKDHANAGRSETEAAPNLTLKGFAMIDVIKQRLENECPRTVSCADILVLAARDGITLSGGPFYPLLTGRRDSAESFYEDSFQDIPSPEDRIGKILGTFKRKGFSERETVTLLGAHNIGSINCFVIRHRVENFTGTGKPDGTLDADWLNHLTSQCNNKQHDSSQSKKNRKTAFNQQLSSSITMGTMFDIHYYQSLLRRRGLLFSDQELMRDPTAADVVRTYASGDGSDFQIDFMQAMAKLSNLGVLTGSQGQIRINCSMVVK